jgi:hypothetical protein
MPVPRWESKSVCMLGETTSVTPPLLKYQIRNASVHVYIFPLFLWFVKCILEMFWLHVSVCSIFLFLDFIDTKKTHVSVILYKPDETLSSNVIYLSFVDNSGISQKFCFVIFWLKMSAKKHILVSLISWNVDVIVSWHVLIVQDAVHTKASFQGIH